MKKLLQVMKVLRGDQGCPWDKEQTHQSLRRHLLEETYELLDAIEKEDKEAMIEELGDVLLQVAFHSMIAMEKNHFTYEDVEARIVRKLISRHTHVFGDDHAANAKDVIQTWNENKKKEKDEKSVAESMKSLPKNFPALVYAYKVQEKASRVGFDWEKPQDAAVKLEEEILEFKEAIREDDAASMESEAGDLLFSMVNVCRLLGVDPHLALHGSAKTFVKRFEKMEKRVREQGLCFSKLSLEQMDEIWELVKREERCANDANG